jgi:hypothetical protein
MLKVMFGQGHSPEIGRTPEDEPPEPQIRRKDEY